MGGKYQNDCKGRSPVHEKLAMDLLEEYEDKLRASKNPDPRKYFERYTGPDKDDFRIELNLITLLVVGIRKRSNKWDKLVASGAVAKMETNIYRKLFGDD